MTQHIGDRSPRLSYRSSLLALVACMLLLAGACGTSGSATPGADEVTSVTIQMDWLLDGSTGAHLYGIEHGIFEDHGIDLELLSGQGSSFSMQQLNEDQVQFAQADLLAYLASRAEEDSPTMVVRPLIQGSTAGILSRQPLGSLEDLEGLTITTAPWGVFRLLLPVVLEENGISGDAVDLELVESGDFALLMAGDVDAIEAHRTGSLPAFLVQAEADDEDVHYLDLNEWYVSYGKLLVVRQDVIEDDPDLVQRLVDAMQESVDGALEADDDEIVDLVLEVAPELQRETVALQWQQMKEAIQHDGSFDRAVFETNLGYVRDAMGIDHDLEPEDVHTDEFVAP